jgi:hypothetical protein
MVTQSRNVSLAMQHEGVITIFSNHAIGPYPKLEESTPFFHTLHLFIQHTNNCDKGAETQNGGTKRCSQSKATAQ